MKFSLKMLQLVKDNSQPFNVVRKIEGHLGDDGSWVDEQELQFESNFMVTTARKEQEQMINIGTTSYQLVKIRQMKNEENLLQVNDTFMFNGFNFKIIKPKIYMEHFSDFYTYFATTEADAQ